MAAPAVQRSVEGEVDEGEAPAIVDTAIGPLPSDLWTIIGAQPPAAPGQADSAPAEATAVQRQAIARAELPAGSIPDVNGAESAPPGVQRRADQDVAAAIAAAEQPPAARAQPAPQAAPSQPAAPPPPEPVAQPEIVTVQRAVVGSEAVISDDMGGSDTNLEEPSANIDTDRLAREVYDEIKRRLTTERERSRYRY